MAPLRISLACIPSDRTRPLLDGRVRIEGCEIEPITGEPEAIFGRALGSAEFGVTELSMASHIVRVAKGNAAYVGVPAFTSRAFRHGSIFIRSDRGIATPKDLAGRRIGVPDYQQTAALWMRGVLLEQYGVAPDSIKWVTGGLDHPVEGQRGGLTLPPRIDVTAIGSGDCLNDALARGDIDGIIAPKPPACFQDGSAPVTRLFSDFGTAERRYAEESGFFPIMHCMAVRHDLAEAHPWLPQAVFKALAEAKALALKEMVPTNVLRLSLPWLHEHAAEARRILGPRFWSYGLPDNRREVEAMIRYAVADGLASEAFDAGALFAPATHALPDIA